MSKTILYGKTRTGKTKIWSAWVIENGKSGYPEIHYEWGMIDGKKQLTIDIIKSGMNEGKANETTPFEQAKLEIGRKAKKKSEEGYIDNLDRVNDQEQTIDFSKLISKETCFYKPKSNIDDKKLKKLEADNQAIFTVKRDGMAHIFRKSKAFGVEIYSRRMDLVTDKYPHLVESLDKLNDGTILLGEIILLRNGQDDFNGVSQICRSDAEKAIQRQKELGKVSYYIFDLAFYNGKNCMVSMKYDDRQNKIKQLTKQCGSEYIIPVEIINKTHQDAMIEVKERNLEGLVIWNKNATMNEGECLTQNGKAYRPNVLWKSKPRYELDAIARFSPGEGIGEYGKGKNSEKMKSVFLYQLDNDGNEVYISKCGGGFSDEQRALYTITDYPKVFRILYDSVQKDGSLRFPVFDIERDDKLVSECFMDEDIKKAMYKEES